MFNTRSSSPTKLPPESFGKVTDYGYGVASPAQGSKKLGTWEFTSAFDGGNALWCSWTREDPVKKTTGSRVVDQEDVTTFSVEIARDCHGQKGQEKPKASWFHFGVKPEPRFKGNVKFVVHGMCEQRDLFAAGYKPWVSTSWQPRWRRLEGDIEVGQSKFFHWQCGWKHTFDGTRGTTFFAFCHPYGYGELMAWLDRLEARFGVPASPPPELDWSIWDYVAIDRSEGAGGELEFLGDGRFAFKHNGAFYSTGTWKASALDPRRLKLRLSDGERYVLRLESWDSGIIEDLSAGGFHASISRRGHESGEEATSGLLARGLGLLQELCEEFAKEAFQRKLVEIDAEHAEHPESCKAARAKHLLSVQSSVLPQHGFAGTREGVWDMMVALGPWFGFDPHLTELMSHITALLGSSDWAMPKKGMSRRCRAECDFLLRFELGPSEELGESDAGSSASSSSSHGEDVGTARPQACDVGTSADKPGLSFLAPGQALGDDDGPKPGVGIYFHRQTLALSANGRRVELLTVTEQLAPGAPRLREELPHEVVQQQQQQQQASNGEGCGPDVTFSTLPPLSFPGRPICFISGRVHPGETPGQFACNGFLQFILSDDPRAGELRKQFVFKVAPMLNPDGVAWGHYRTSTLGYDLNRCYRNPTPELHEGVFAVKAMLLKWARQRELLFYMDCHGHAARRGCFLFGNHHGSQVWSSEDALLWNVAYVHLTQLNCPHIDVDACEWSRAIEAKKSKSGGEEQDDEVDETSRSDSGRAQIGASCRLYHAYTLECNYHISRTVRPSPKVPGLPSGAYDAQALVAQVQDGSKRPKPAPYGPREWAAVGEALAVALLDLHCVSSHSRLLEAPPPKPLLPPDKDLAHVNVGLERLFSALTERHRSAAGKVSEKSAAEAAATLSAAAAGLRRRIFKVVHSPHVYIRDKPVKTGSALGIRRPEDAVVVLEVRSDGWVQLDPSELEKLTRKNCTEAYMMVDGKAVGLGTLLADTRTFAMLPLSLYVDSSEVPPQMAHSVEEVEQGKYPWPCAVKLHHQQQS